MRWYGMVRRFVDNPDGFYIDSRPGGDPMMNSRFQVTASIGSLRTAFDEQMVFAEVFQSVGPYIALGRPTETFQDMDLGAAKTYVSDADWRTVVSMWLRDCGAVVLDAAHSASLGWEIEQVVQVVPPEHVLLICPETEAQYATFVDAHGTRFPQQLPAARPPSRLIIFDADWRASALDSVPFNAALTLAPFLRKLEFTPTLRILDMTGSRLDGRCAPYLGPEALGRDRRGTDGYCNAGRDPTAFTTTESLR